MNIPILYEDSDVLVIDKPFGVIVNRSKTAKGETIQDWAEEKIQRSKDPKIQIKKTENYQLFIERSGVVHRLDKDTSGCLMIAKNPDSLINLLAQFKERKIKKEYSALVHGTVKPEKGSVNAPIGRLPWRKGLFGVMPGGKQALTHYAVDAYYQYEKQDYSLLKVKIETGRTHQIRVHLQYIGHPVVGDKWYAGRKRTRKSAVWCSRLFLHASYIKHTHPGTGRPIEVSCPLPAELSGVLDKLVKTL